MAGDLADVATVTEKVIQQLEQAGVVSLNASKKMGILEKQQMKLSTAMQKSPITGILRSLAGFASSISNVTKKIANHSAMTDKENETLDGKMTLLQKLIAQKMMFGGVAKMNNKILAKSNNIFTRLATRVFSLISIFLIVGFALAALSIAFDGANTPLLGFTENMGFVHDAVQGLVLILSGEGDEEGLAALFDILAASVLVTAAAFVFFSGTVAITLGILTATVGVFQLVQNETGSMELAIAAATATFLVFAGAVLYLKFTFGVAATSAIASTMALVGVVLLALGLLTGGIAALWLFVQGTGDTFIDWVIGIVGTLLIYGALVLAFGATIPVAIAAGIIFIIAIIIKYWDQIVAFLGGVMTFIFEWGATIFYGALAGLGMLFGGIVALLTGAISLVIGLVVGIFTALFDIGASFAEDVIFGGGSLIDWFLSIPKTIKNGFVKGFKSVFNAVMGIYNKFARKMKFDIPNWVPVVGGKTFKLPTVPMLAKGGVVNSPTLAMIGEDGPEAVVPLSRKNNPQGIGLGGGGGVTVNINVGGVTDRTDKKQLAKEIGDLIRAEMARGGRSGGNRRSAV